MLLKIKMQILRWQLNYGVFLVLNRVKLLEFYVNLFIFPKRFNIQTLQAKPESQNARQLSFRRFFLFRCAEFEVHTKVVPHHQVDLKTSLLFWGSVLQIVLQILQKFDSLSSDTNKMV